MSDEDKSTLEPEMPEPTFRSDMTVDLVKSSASDSDVVWAARVSTEGEKSLDAVTADPERSAGLIRFLMRERHGTPYEQNSMTYFVSAPIFVFREFMRHRIGFCVAGDTKVTLERVTEGSGRVLRHVEISELYRRWHVGVEDTSPPAARRRPVKVGNIWTASSSVDGQQVYLGTFPSEEEAQDAIDAFRAANPTVRRRLLPASRDLSVRVLNEDTQFFEQGRAVDVIQSGEKELMTIRAANGSVLRCTEDHAIYTADGWRKAGELEPGEDRIAVASRRSLYAGRQIPPSLRRGIGVWTSMQRQTLIRPIDYCSECAGQFLRGDLVLDHVVPVTEDLRLALDLTNLQPLCNSCHRVKTDSEQVLARRGMGAGSRFVSFTIDDGRDVEMTYDLSVEGPWHNFVANGVVVHNSYNEESGRYRELQPVFYVPGEDRKLVQQGKPGAYDFVEGTSHQHELVVAETKRAYTEAYEAYKRMLSGGIAREVARTVLPVGIYSSMYVTCNARSLMAFLSLRTKREDSKFPSYPQREIEMVAEKMEAEWARLMPITYEAFNANGRVSP